MQFRWVLVCFSVSWKALLCWICLCICMQSNNCAFVCVEEDINTVKCAQTCPFQALVKLLYKRKRFIKEVRDRITNSAYEHISTAANHGFPLPCNLMFLTQIGQMTLQSGLCLPPFIMHPHGINIFKGVRKCAEKNSIPSAHALKNKTKWKKTPSGVVAYWRIDRWTDRQVNSNSAFCFAEICKT